MEDNIQISGFDIKVSDSPFRNNMTYVYKNHEF